MIDLIKLVTSNAATVCRLGEDKQFVIIINTVEHKIAVPILPKGDSLYGYYTVTEDDAAEQLVQKIFESVVKSKKFGVLPPKITLKAVVKIPEHNHMITEVVRPMVSGFTPTLPEDFNSICEKLGYMYTPSCSLVPIRVRDYSEIAKVPKYAKLIADNHERVEKLHHDVADLPAEAKIAMTAIKNGFYDSVFFKGETGTGKTELCRIIADKLGAPMYEKGIDGGTRPEDFVGEWTPADEKDVPFKFRPGPLLEMFVEGGFMSAQELPQAVPETLAALNPFLDGSPYVIVGNQVYHRNPNFVFLATGNPGYEGTLPFNISLKNRLVLVELPAIDKLTFGNWSDSFCKNLGREFDRELFDQMYDLAELIEKESTTTKWHENVKFSIRNAQRFYQSIIPQDLDYDEFTAAYHIQYTNILSMDNNNAKALKIFKEGELMKSKIKSLYEVYSKSKIGFKTSKDITSTVALLATADTDTTATPGTGKGGFVAGDPTGSIAGLFGGAAATTEPKTKA